MPTYITNWLRDEIVAKSNEPRDVLAYEEFYDAVLAEAREIAMRKRAEYGTANITKQGLSGVLDRVLLDKSARLGRLSQIVKADHAMTLVVQEAVRLSLYGDSDLAELRLAIRSSREAAEKDPGIRDDILDIINYLIIAIALIEGTWDSEGV